MTHPHPQPARPRAWNPMAATLAVALAAGAGTVWTVRAAATGGAAPAAAPATTLTVNGTSVKRSTWPQRLQASGAIAPREEISVAAEVGGVRIAQVHVDVGDAVAAGQVLARLDDATLKAEEAELAAELQRASAALRQARTTLDRNSSLDAAAAISPHELEQHRVQAEMAAGEQARLAAKLELKRVQLQRTLVRAPHGGVVSSRTALTGSVAAGGQELFRLLRDNRMEWRAELTAAQLAQVRPRQPVTLQLPDGSGAQGVVRQVAPTVAAQSRMGVAFADLDQGGGARAGMYATGSLDIGSAPALVLPASAVVLRDGRTTVARLSRAGDVHRVTVVPVQVGRRQGAEVEVLGGLQLGDEVVQTGAGLLGEGDLVRLVASGPATLAATGGSR